MTANSRVMAQMGVREIAAQFRTSVLPFTDQIVDESLRIVARDTAEHIEHLLERLSRPLPFTEDSCPGHVASKFNGKICARCGTHIDSLRPPEDDCAF